jgi:Flp pilus assembly protein TadG
VEFALVCGLLCVLLIGAVELGRMAWMWNAAVEATRHGARLAVVCDIGDARIAQRMAGRLPGLRPDQVRIDYLATGQPANACGRADCEAVRVAIVDVEHQTFVPLLARTIGLPPMSTTLRREAMDSTANAACQ